MGNSNNKNSLVLNCSAEIDLAASESGDKRPSFTINAYNGGAIMAGYYRPIVVDLSGLRAGVSVPILLDHDSTQIVGQASKIKVTKSNVTLAGTITGDTSNTTDPAYKVVSHAKNGFTWAASIGFSIDTNKLEFVGEGVKAKANGQTFTGPVYIARSGRLGEVSFVAIGADEHASASVAASASIKEQNMDFAWLKAAGFDIDSLTDEQKAKLQAAYEMEQAAANDAKKKKSEEVKASDPQDDPIEKMRVQAAAEISRQNDIRDVCGTEYGDIAVQAIKAGWNKVQTEREVFKKKLDSIGTIRTTVNASGPENLQVLEAALCLRNNVGSEKQLLASYGEKTLNQADKYRKLGLRRTIEAAAAMKGIQLPMDVGTEWMRAAFSSSELTGIVGAVANKALANTFAASRDVVPQITRATSHGNFHTHTVYSMALTGDLEKVAPTGELKSLNLGEESWTRQVETRGAMLKVTRNDIINDELGALTSAAERMARKALVSRAKAVFKLLNATGNGASFFTAARGNYFEGAATSLSISSLGTAVQMFRDQTGPDGDPVMIEPKILLVPTALEETSKGLMDSNASMIAVALASTAAKAKEPNVNVWAGAFTPVISEWLSKSITSDGSTQAGSSTAWYLLADPNDVPAIEVAYLNGQQTPTIEYFGMDQDVNTLGISWRVFWDFGVALAEYRAGVKSKGAA